ncbi:zinc-ribbon domain-containing protein [Gordonia westfalica]|uniref:zinc-ribbon domain-containing protein n=1 Tax=Gordonia westfalica TaxID=158898 RepID=UPI000944203B
MPASQSGWWECRSCGNLWQESQSSRRLRKWCRKCAGKQGAEVNRGNAATASRIAVHLQGEWIDEKPHTSVSAKSNYKAAWRCGTCGHEWRATVKNRSNGSGCHGVTGSQIRPVRRPHGHGPLPSQIHYRTIRSPPGGQIATRTPRRE